MTRAAAVVVGVAMVLGCSGIPSSTPPEPPPAETPAAEGAEGETPPEPAPEPEKKDVAKEASELNERLAPWAVAVATYKADVLVRRMKDLLDEPTPAETGVDGGLDGLLDGMGVDHEEGEGSIEPMPTPDDEGGAAPPPEPEKKPE